MQPVAYNGSDATATRIKPDALPFKVCRMGSPPFNSQAADAPAPPAPRQTVSYLRDAHCRNSIAPHAAAAPLMSNRRAATRLRMQPGGFTDISRRLRRKADTAGNGPSRSSAHGRRAGIVRCTGGCRCTKDLMVSCRRIDAQSSGTHAGSSRIRTGRNRGGGAASAANARRHSAAAESHQRSASASPSNSANSVLPLPDM